MENNGNIKAVTFDLWETLLFERDGYSSRRSAVRCRNVTEVLNEFGLHVSIEQAESALKHVVASLVRVWDNNADVGHVEQLELLVRLVSHGSLDLNNEWVEKLSSAYVSAFFEVPPYLNPDADKVLSELAESGKQIGLICNTGLTPGFALRRFLESEGVLEYFDLLVFSDEIGFRKPDSKIFHFLARKLKVNPKNIVHVGDNLRVDVWGAKNAGFRAIFFSCEEGKDGIAEADPTSLVTLSRSLGTMKAEEIIPDKTITQLSALARTIKEIENIKP